MQTELIQFRIVGTTALMMNNPASMQGNDGGARPAGLGAKTIPTPQDEASAKVYRFASGQLYLPMGAFRSSLAEGMKGQKIPRVRTSPKALVKSTVFTAREEMLLERPTGEPIMAFDTIDIRRCVLQGKNGVVRARPVVMPWAGVIEFEYDPACLTPQLLLEGLTIGGQRVGVGDYRPEKSGPFGRYTVEWVQDEGAHSRAWPSTP